MQPQQKLGQARRITYDIPNAGQALLRAEESRRLNLRALARADSGPGLRQGLESLEHSAVVVRSFLRSIAASAHRYGEQHREFSSELRETCALLMRGMASCLRIYGRR